MNWFFLSLACALFTATTAAISKTLLRKRDEFSVLWITYALALPFLLIMFIKQPRPELTLDFCKVMAIMLPIEATAVLMYLHALKTSPISLVFPFLGLTPVFSIFTSSLILNEKFTPLGIGGIVLVSLGAYLVNVHSIKDGALAPIKNMLKEKGVLLMIAVAFLFSFTSVFGKKAVLLTSPETFPAVYYTIFCVLLLPIVVGRWQRSRRRQVNSGHAPSSQNVTRKEVLLFLVMGASFGMAILFHYKAISLVNVSYMISVKRLSLIIGVFYGALIFKEKNIGYRLLGTAVIVAGVMVLSLAG
ncbi:MAG: EamA family transporter [Candidatus Omnitrophica bacterium]|nr:EamA family transporter [Candidatus Omnitrophota bacterium]